MYDACIFVANSHVWYFDSGATKHITSQHDIFNFLEFAPTRNILTCTDNSLYPAKGIGTIVLTIANVNAFTLKHALYVCRIKKNLLSIFALTRQICG